MAEIELETEGLNEALQAVEGVADALTDIQILERSVRAAVRPTVRLAKKLVPQPGYPGDKPGLKPLRDTIGVRLKRYRGAVVAIAGPQWPAGAHAYNVEHGHGGPAPAPPHPYMEPAIQATQQQVQSEFENSYTAQIQKKYQEG